LVLATGWGEHPIATGGFPWLFHGVRIKQKFDFVHEGKVCMNKANSPVNRIKMGLGIALLAASMGCVGYMDGGYGGGYDGGYVGAPDMYVFGGEYERGRDVHEYSHRGSVSRGSAHPAASSSAHSGGGGARGGKR
jgi:hypothetical protein